MIRMIGRYIYNEWLVKEEALRIGERFLNQMPEIREENEIKWKKGTGESFRLLCTLLKGNAIRTKTLNLYSNNHPWVRVGWQIMMKKVTIIGNNIGDDGARMISEGLKSNSTLTTLNLSCDEEERGIHNVNDKNEINREQYWSRRS